MSSFIRAKGLPISQFQPDVSVAIKIRVFTMILTLVSPKKRIRYFRISLKPDYFQRIQKNQMFFNLIGAVKGVMKLNNLVSMKLAKFLKNIYF